MPPVGLEKVQVCLEECVFRDFPCDEDVFHICVDLTSEHNLKLTTDVFETVNLYTKLRELINNALDLEHYLSGAFVTFYTTSVFLFYSRANLKHIC